MLVGVGLKNKSFEVIDLSSTTSTCAKIANFPLEDDTSFGGLNYQNKPIICQKENQPFDGSQWSHCLIYNEDSWQSYFDYNFPVVTDPATTTFQTLGNTDIPVDASISVYPNPTKGNVNVNCGTTIRSIQLCFICF